MAGVRRRDVLVRGGAVAVSALVVGGLVRNEGPGLNLVDGFSDVYDIVRTDDQLTLKVTLIAINVVTENGKKFLVADHGFAPPPTIAFEFPVQHTMEWAHPSQNPKVPVHAAQRNFLQVLVPDGVKVPLTTAGLLGALRDFAVYSDPYAGVTAQSAVPGAQAAVVPAADVLRAAMAPVLDRRVPASDAYRAETARRIAALTPDISDVVGQQAEPPGPPAAQPPPDDAFPPAMSYYSQICGPGRLIFHLPGGNTRFTHALEPVRNDDLVELWHTRMTQLGGTGRVESALTITTPNYVFPGTAPGNWADDMAPDKLTSLTPDEAGAVYMQARRNDPNKQSALTMNHLRMSPVAGLSTQVSGRWKQLPTEASPPAVRSFKSRLVNGRDIVFRKEVSGRLYPFGHAAVLETTVERRFQSSLSAGTTRLEKKDQITVTEHLRTYTAHTFPFGSVEILTDSTPAGLGTGLTGYPAAQYLQVEGATFTFALRGVDKAGKAVDFRMPLLFIPDTHADFTGLAAAYATAAGADGVTFASTGLGHLSVAEPAPAPGPGANLPRIPGATEVVADSAVFTGFAANADADIVPAVTQFVGRLPALGHLTDQAAMTVTYAPRFVTHGFSSLPGTNPGEVVLALGAALPVDLTDAKAVGGLIAPVKAELSGMSRRLGAVAGSLDAIADGSFDPTTYLKNVLAGFKLFGVFALGELIKAAGLDDAPRISAINLDGLRTRTFTWTVPLFQNQQDIGTDIARLRPSGGPARLTVTSVVSVGATGGQAHQHTTCRIENVAVAVRLGPDDLVTVPFTSITFDSVDGAKPTVDVDLGAVEFGGVLGFVNRLAELIDKAGFRRPQGPSTTNAAVTAAADASGGGPSLDITTTGVRAGFSLAVPAVAIGIFALENISFGATLDLPFEGGSPALEFNFATYDNPFRLTVSLLGGGGFLGLRLSTGGGLEWLEGSIEFGAQLAINLGGVIKGKVSAMGGVYFKLADGSTTLTGYFSITGEVSVLSLITVGVVQTLALEYRDKKLSGSAELVFYISTFFFHKTIRKKFERTFVGSNGDPTFAELMGPGGAGPRPWDAYCTAYA